MNVLVDTPAWSAVFRRRGKGRRSDYWIEQEMVELIRDMRAEMIGPIRQELLAGIQDRDEYETLRVHLRAFVDLPIVTEDYEQAAEFFTVCRRRGIQGSHIDFLICAISVRYQFPIFTLDEDFAGYRRYLPVTLHVVRRG